MTAAVLAPRGVRRTAQGLAVRRAVVHGVRPLHGRPIAVSRSAGSGVAIPMPGETGVGFIILPKTTARAVGVAARERDAQGEI